VGQVADEADMHTRLRAGGWRLVAGACRGGAVLPGAQGRLEPGAGSLEPILSSPEPGAWSLEPID